MIPYRNLSRKSGVHSFALGEDTIEIKFIGKNTIYTYYKSNQVAYMKELAIAGSGLNTYIINNNPSFRKKYYLDSTNKRNFLSQA